MLRKQWGWNGFVVTDYGSIAEITKHGLGDLQQASVMALKAGTDMDMCAEGYIKTLEQSLKEGKVTMAEIDQACRRVLEAKYILGLFDNPYRFLDPKRHEKDIYTLEHRQAARQLAAESFVLLKNERIKKLNNERVLPLKKQGKIALIGPMADNRINMAGTWAPTAANERYATLKEAMERALAGKATVSYAQGCNFTSDSTLQKDGGFYRQTPFKDAELLKREALNIARDADVIVCAMGESAEMSGECSSRATLEMFDTQRELLEALLALGKPLVVLNFAGRPLFPFGFGLSYTTFDYSDIRLNGRKASVTVTNTGDYDGVEIVQLYIHDVVASITRPVKELKGFQRIHLKKGESREVTFEIADDLLKFYNSSLDYVLEPGDFEIMIGPDSSLKHLKKAVLTVE